MEEGEGRIYFQTANFTVNLIPWALIAFSEQQKLLFSNLIYFGGFRLETFPTSFWKATRGMICNQDMFTSISVLFYIFFRTNLFGSILGGGGGGSFLDSALGMMSGIRLLSGTLHDVMYDVRCAGHDVR